MLRGFYSFIIFFYLIIIRLLALSSPKAKAWVRGRRELWKELESIPKGRRIIWIHCASLGEFEQARPVLEALREEFPHFFLLLTFFSPSGYEVRKDFKGVDKVTYLPIDLPTHAKKFIQLVKPEMALFVKYEFWFNLIHTAYQHDCALYLISGVFRPNQHFFRWSGWWQRRHLHYFSHCFVQDADSANLLSKIGIHQVTVSGDTRFDRVVGLPKFPSPPHLSSVFKAEDFVVVAGSTYEPDERILADLLSQLPDIQILIAPHEVSETRVTSIMRRFSTHGAAYLGSEYNGQECRTIVIDSIGILSTLYRHADIGYIGGGFGSGIHNILEAATYGIPICFGPAWKKFNEAKMLIEIGGAFEISGLSSLEQRVRSLMDNPELRATAGARSREFVKAHSGATKIIISELRKSLAKEAQ